MNVMQDDEFSRRLAERRRLLPEMESDPIEPDAELDRRVLEHARRELAPAPPPARETRPFRGLQWALPVALAATLVLSFTLVLLTPDRAAGPVDETAVAMSAPAPAETGGAATQAADATLASEAAPAVTAAPPPPVAAAPPPPSPPVAVAVPAPTPPRVATAPPPAPSLSADATARSAAIAAHTSAAAADAASPEATASALPAAVQADPDAWFAEIERLRAAGDAAAADREWAAFRERWPDDPRSR